MNRIKAENRRALNNPIFHESSTEYGTVYAMVEHVKR